MNPRRLGTLGLLVVLGVAGGFGLGALRDDEAPSRIVDAAPVVATSPEMPSNPEVEVLDDPDTPELRPGLPTHEEKIGSKPFKVQLEVPDDWYGTVPTPGEWRWYAPGEPNNTYFLRVRLVGNRYEPVSIALEERIRDLEGAESVQDFDLESRSEDTFVASYVSQGYRRVAVESFVSIDGDDTADVWLAAIGRERDRIGLSDLLSRVKSNLSYVD